MKIIKRVRYYGRQYDIRENEERCIEEIWGTNGWVQYQCNRKRSHGPDGLYCKQHDPERIKAKQEAEKKKWKQDHDRRKKQSARRELEREFCKPMTNTELKAGIKAGKGK